jgi:hypothetical protein
MPRPTNSFKTLGGGVPVHYDRLPSPDHYGSRGKEHTFYCEEDFEALLDDAFKDLWLYTGLGKAQVITSAGAYTDKPGQHGEGRALDIDGIFWSNTTFITLHAGWQGQDRRFYFGIEAVLRRHFGVVLDYEYNAPHRDHFHVDDSNSLGFRKTSRSKVRSLQGMLNNVWGKNVDEDGDWGNQTAGAVSEVLLVAGLPGPITIPTQWLLLMKKTAEKAFGTKVD